MPSCANPRASETEIANAILKGTVSTEIFERFQRSEKALVAVSSIGLPSLYLSRKAALTKDLRVFRKNHCDSQRATKTYQNSRLFGSELAAEFQHLSVPSQEGYHPAGENKTSLSDGVRVPTDMIAEARELARGGTKQPTPPKLSGGRCKRKSTGWPAANANCKAGREANR